MYSQDALKFPELILFQLTLNTQRLPMKMHLVLQGKKKKKKATTKNKTQHFKEESRKQRNTRNKLA